MKLYGLRNCDTCRKAVKWLAENDAAAEFVDIRETPVARKKLIEWGAILGDASLVNKSSTTWRGLADSEKDSGDWIGLIDLHPTLLKRPVLELKDGSVIQGFKPATYAETLL